MSWIAYIAPAIWCGMIWAIAGAPAAFFSALTGLITGLFAMWEVGRNARKATSHPTP